MAYIQHRDWKIESALGNNGVIVVDKFGRNTAIGTTLEDIWDGGGAWVAPTTARTHDLASTDNDDGAGAATGALTVAIEGLDASGNIQSETVTLNGTTNAPTGNTYTMIHRMVVATAGSSGRNEGTITATAQTDATVTARIEASATAPPNQTRMAIYKVPTGYTGIVTGMYYHINAGSPAADFTMHLTAKPSGGVWNVKYESIEDASDYRRILFDAPKKFSAGTFVKIEALASTGTTTDISAGFDMFVVPD